MTESTLKSALMEKLRTELRWALCFRHEDKYTKGIPDISVNGMGGTTWWEVKYAHPSIERDHVQELMMKRMGTACAAMYIIYQDDSDGKWVRIVEPRRVPDTWRLSTICAEGFDHDFVVDFIKRAHYLRKV